MSQILEFAGEHMVFDSYKVFETELAGRPLVVSTGKTTQLANGACMVQYGETTVHVAATASAKPRDGIDFFPLSVDFEEKLYSVGKIPGSFSLPRYRQTHPSSFPEGYAQRCFHRRHRHER